MMETKLNKFSASESPQYSGGNNLKSNRCQVVNAIRKAWAKFCATTKKEEIALWVSLRKLPGGGNYKGFPKIRKEEKTFYKSTKAQRYKSGWIIQESSFQLEFKLLKRKKVRGF